MARRPPTDHRNVAAILVGVGSLSLAAKLLGDFSDGAERALVAIAACCSLVEIVALIVRIFDDRRKALTQSLRDPWAWVTGLGLTAVVVVGLATGFVLGGGDARSSSPSSATLAYEKGLGGAFDRLAAREKRLQAQLKAATTPAGRASAARSLSAAFATTRRWVVGHHPPSAGAGGSRGRIAKALEAMSASYTGMAWVVAAGRVDRRALREARRGVIANGNRLVVAQQ